MDGVSPVIRRFLAPFLFWQGQFTKVSLFVEQREATE